MVFLRNSGNYGSDANDRNNREWDGSRKAVKPWRSVCLAASRLVAYGLSCIECVADVDHKIAVLDAAVFFSFHGVGEADFVGDAGTELVVEHNLGAEAQAEVKAVHLPFAAEELVHGLGGAGGAAGDFLDVFAVEAEGKVWAEVELQAYLLVELVAVAGHYGDFEVAGVEGRAQRGAEAGVAAAVFGAFHRVEQSGLDGQRVQYGLLGHDADVETYLATP